MKSLNAVRIFRDSSKLSASSVLGFGLVLVVNVMIGRYLTPEEVGIFAIVTVWTFYSQLVRPGLLAAAGRDVPHLLGEGDVAQAKRVQNVALTGELLFALVPFAVVGAAAFIYKGWFIRSAFLVAAVAMVISSIQSTIGGMFYVYGRFDIAARLRIVVSVVGPAGILLTIRHLGIFSLLAMPGIAGICALGLMWMHRDVIGFRPMWDRGLARYMIRVGAPFCLLTIVSWGYFMSDRPALIAAGLPLAVIGYYSFASNLIRSVAQVFWDFTAVLQPILWQEMGRQGSAAAIGGQLASVWVPYTAVACAAASFGQALFGAVVRAVAPRFLPSVPVFEILVFILVFYNASQLPNLVLNSKRVGRQNTTLVMWTAGLVLNAGLLYALARAGMGIQVIAAASMLVDAIVVIAGFRISHRYLFSADSGFRFYAWQSACAATSVLVFFVLRYTPLTYDSGRSIWLMAIERTLVPLVVWSFVGWRMWRWIASMNDGERDGLSDADCTAPVAIVKDVPLNALAGGNPARVPTILDGGPGSPVTGVKEK